MLKILARNLLNYTTEQLFDLVMGDFILVFDDGEIVTNERETLYSSFIWDFHREYPNTPLKKTHFVKEFMNQFNEIQANTHLAFINRVLWEVYDAYADHVPDNRDLRDKLARLGYLITNNIYNSLTLKLEKHVTSLDLLDFIQLAKDPKLVKIKEDLPPTEDGVISVNTRVREMLKKDPTYVDNSLSRAVRTGLSREGQALQCVGVRGFLTDIDSSVFRMPIRRGYVEGMTTLYDSMIESRSAAKSLANSEKPLQDSEYFSRRQQLICQNVQHLVPGDCGSTNYQLWKVRGEQFHGDNKVSDGDLFTIVGKYYLNEETNKLEAIKTSDKHLIGKTIKLRSVIAGCRCTDPYGVCETCFGQLSLSVPKGSNLGHACCVELTSKMGQLILSTKHYDSSSKVEGIVLKPNERRYLEAETNGHSYYLSPRLKNKEVSILINTLDASGLADIRRVDDVKILNISRVSEIDVALISVKDGEDEEITSLDLSVNRRKASLTHDFLDYLQKEGYLITPENRYQFNMSNWDFKKPIFTLPLSHFNTSDHQKEVAKMLESTTEDLDVRSSEISPEAMLVDLYDVINRRLSVNLAIIEIILYGSMTIDATNGQYGLPKTFTKKGLGIMRLVMRERSLSASMGFQGHKEILLNPAMYLRHNRPDHPFDPILIPEEVLK